MSTTTMNPTLSISQTEYQELQALLTKQADAKKALKAIEDDISTKTATLVDKLEAGAVEDDPQGVFAGRVLVTEKSLSPKYSDLWKEEAAEHEVTRREGVPTTCPACGEKIGKAVNFKKLLLTAVQRSNDGDDSEFYKLLQEKEKDPKVTYRDLFKKFWGELTYKLMRASLPQKKNKVLEVYVREPGQKAKTLKFSAE